MFFNRRVVLAALAVSGCAPQRRSDAPLSLDQVLARHAQARGGAAALDAITNTLNVAQVTEPSFSVLGRYVASVEGRMRVDIFYDGARAFSEGIDAEGAWDWNGDAAAPKDFSTLGAAALAHGIEFNLFGLHALSRRGHSLTLEGREAISGVNYYKLKLRLADGFETWRYINPDTWMIDRGRDFRPLHPDVDATPVWIETEYSDYRAVRGVMTSFAWIQRNVASGEHMQTGAIHRLDYNVAPEQLNFPRQATVIAP